MRSPKRMACRWRGADRRHPPRLSQAVPLRRRRGWKARLGRRLLHTATVICFCSPKPSMPNGRAPLANRPRCVRCRVASAPGRPGSAGSRRPSRCRPSDGAAVSCDGPSASAPPGPARRAASRPSSTCSPASRRAAHQLLVEMLHPEPDVAMPVETQHPLALHPDARRPDAPSRRSPNPDRPSSRSRSRQRRNARSLRALGANSAPVSEEPLHVRRPMKWAIFRP